VRRADPPPPGFILMAMGYLSGLLGPVLWLCGTQGWVSGQAMLFGAILLHQAFALFLLLGVATFLLPRVLGVRELEATDEPSVGRRHAAFTTITGFALLASDWLEAGHPSAPAAAWLRCGAAAAYLIATVPLHRQSRPLRTTAAAAQLALLALVAGLLFPLVWPGQRLAGLHVVFLGGFSLMVFTVATRVVLGHAGQGALFDSRLPALQTATVLILAATALRAAGDFLPTRPHWLSGASYLWMLAAGIWGFAVLPKVRIVPSTPE